MEDLDRATACQTHTVVKPYCSQQYLYLSVLLGAWAARRPIKNDAKSGGHAPGRDLPLVAFLYGGPISTCLSPATCWIEMPPGLTCVCSMRRMLLARAFRREAQQQQQQHRTVRRRKPTANVSSRATAVNWQVAQKNASGSVTLVKLSLASVWSMRTALVWRNEKALPGMQRASLRTKLLLTFMIGTIGSFRSACHFTVALSGCAIRARLTVSPERPEQVMSGWDAPSSMHGSHTFGPKHTRDARCSHTLHTNGNGRSHTDRCQT